MPVLVHKRGQRLAAAWFIAFALMQFPVGWALDRIGPRRTVTALMSIGAIAKIGIDPRSTK